MHKLLAKREHTLNISNYSKQHCVEYLKSAQFYAFAFFQYIAQHNIGM